MLKWWKKHPIQYQLVSEQAAMKIELMAAGASVAVGCLCAAAGIEVHQLISSNLVKIVLHYSFNNCMFLQLLSRCAHEIFLSVLKAFPKISYAYKTSN